MPEGRARRRLFRRDIRSAVAAGLERARAAFGPVNDPRQQCWRGAQRAVRKTDLASGTMSQYDLNGVYLVSRAVLPDMQRARRGRAVINVASTAGLIGYAYVAAYCAAKHGLIGLTRALALELAKTGVTVNAVCPGFTDTPLFERAIETIVAKTGRREELKRRLS